MKRDARPADIGRACRLRRVRRVAQPPPVGLPIVCLVTAFALACGLGDAGAVPFDAGLDEPLEVCRLGPVAPLRIAPMGDSTTQGDTSHLSYRYRLWELLRDTGARIDFIGTEFQHWGGTREYPDPSFDPDHEGHWGESAVTYVESFPLRTWAVAADVALVHLGTNDTFSYTYPPPSAHEMDIAAEALAGLVAQLRARNPDMHIYLAQIMPIAALNRNQLANLLNVRIARLAERLSTQRSPVFAVDQNSGFDPALHSYDGLHPNEEGERMLAQRWFDAIRTLLPAHTPCALGSAAPVVR